MLWRLSNAARLLIRRLPPRPKQCVTDLIAVTIYWPIALALGAAYALLPDLSAATDPIQVNWLKSFTLIPGGRYSLSVAWTLTFEVFFYLLLGVALALRLPRWRWCCIAAPSLLAVVLPLSGVSVGFGQATSLARFWLVPISWSFCWGVLWLCWQLSAGPSLQLSATTARCSGFC